MLTPAQCQKVKEVCYLLPDHFGVLVAKKQTTEALVNGGCNYNDPKVA